MPSSSDINTEQNFLEQWMSNVSRAGVLINPTFPMLDTKQNSPLSEGSPFTDNLNEEFFHKEHQLGSGYGGRLEMAEAGHFAVRRQMLPIEEVSAEWENSSVDFLQDNGDVHRVKAYSDPLLQKLEQLKELQQQKQEQLKRQQMEQLQRLMEEQKKLLTMVSVQPSLAGFSTTSEQISPRSGTSTGYATETRSIPQLHSNACQNANFSSCFSSDVQTVILPTLNGLDYSLPASRKVITPSNTEEQITSMNVLEHSQTDEYRKKAPMEMVRYENDDEAKEPMQERTSHEDDVDFSANNEGNNYVFDPREERQIMPVMAKKQSFEELLEEQMRLEEQRLKQTVQQQSAEKSNVKKLAVKRPFLKRGEGTARFKNPKSKVVITKGQHLITQQSNAEEKMMSKMHRPQMLQRKTEPSSKELVCEDVVGIMKKPNQNDKAKHFIVANQKEAILGNKDVNNKSSKTLNEQTENKRAVQFEHSVKSNLNRDLDANKENIMNSVNRVEMTSMRKKNVHINEQMQKNTVLTARFMCDPLKIEHFSFDRSFQKRAKSWETEKEKEHIELDEFLLLEEAAEDLSFSSNSSFVQKLLMQDQQISKGHRLSSTPLKVVWHQKEISSIKKGRQGNEMGHLKEDGSVERVTNVRKDSISPKGEAEKLKACTAVDNPTLQDVAWETSSDEDDRNSNVTSDSEDFETTLTNEKEEAKQSEISCEDNPSKHVYDAPSSNISKQNKSKDLDLDLSDQDENSSDESTVVENDSKPNGSILSKKKDSLNVIDMEFDDEKTWADIESDGDQNDMLDNNTIAPPPDLVHRGPKNIGEKAIKRKVASIKKGEDLPKSAVAENSANANPSSNLMLKLFPALKTKPIPDTQQRPEPTPNSILEPVSADSGRSQVLKEKLAELETEIERFKVDNASLAKLRAEQEKAVEHFRNELADFEQRKANELAQIEEYKKEEIKKLQKERKVFEKYATAARAIPDKKERDEIQALKHLLADLQEELKRKELKWSTTHGRLRNQIETVTKENAELREEIRVMEKFRLKVWKKAEAAETNKKSGTNGISFEKENLISSTSVFKNQISSPVLHSEKHAKLNSMIHPPHKGKLSGKCKPTCATETEDQNAGKNIPCKEDVQTNQRAVLRKGSNDGIQGEIAYSDGKVEQILRNGCHVILFPNGTRKETSADGKSLTVTFFNGDVKQVLPDQTVIYYFADAQTTHTTYPDGLEVLHFSNGQIEKHFSDGKKEITFPDQTVKNLFLDGREESIFPDGTIIRVNVDGSKIIEFDNGQREVHTSNFKRREYPDGTVKTVYNNGHQETKFTSGRVRIKDRDGNVIMDTK